MGEQARKNERSPSMTTGRSIPRVVLGHYGFVGVSVEYPTLLAFLAVVAWKGPGDSSLGRRLGLIPLWTDGVSAAATVIGTGAALSMRLVLHRTDLTAAGLYDASNVQ
jgi:hypothetical protein